MDRTTPPLVPSPLAARPYVDFDYPHLVARSRSEIRWTAGPEGFRVEEIPLYPFSGDGEHAALTVEKVARTTRDVATDAARDLGIPFASIGYAGMKDKDCTSVQSFTVAGVPEVAAVRAFEEAGCRILAATRHRNKLRLGHLKGNRFRLRLQGCPWREARAVLEELERKGVPNYFGPQRFGARGDNAALGLKVLQGSYRAGRWKRDLLVSALQSTVFNAVLARRLEAGAFGAAIEGDVLRKEDSGGLFVCESSEADQPRVSRFEVSPTGPIPGRKMLRPAGRIAEEERAVLGGFGLEESLFSGETGSRRPLRVGLTEGFAEEAEDGCWLTFALPAGAYATSVIREVTGGPLERV